MSSRGISITQAEPAMAAATGTANGLTAARSPRASTPRRLTAAELAAYQDSGFVVIPEVFPPQELEALDQEIDRLLPEHEDRAGHRPGWIMQVGMHSSITRRVAEDERLLALIEDIVQPGIAIHSTKLVTKLPHSDLVCHWHQDEAFYLKPDNPATHSRTRMSIWLPLQDAHEQNGCLWVVPGSHRWGLEDFHIVDYGQCRRVIDREHYANEHAIPLPVAAGSVVLFSAYLWHHSKGNTTDRVRRAFIVSYQEATVAHHGPEWRVLRPAA